MKVETHEIQKDRTCARCGIMLPEITRDGHAIDVRVGDHIGLITGLAIGVRAYLITKPEHDSNSPCIATETPNMRTLDQWKQ